MARRRNKEADLIGVAGTIAGLVVLGMMISPYVRQGIMNLVIGLVGLLVVTILFWAFFPRSDQSTTPEPVDRHVTCKMPKLADSASLHEPPNPASFISQLHTIDWFQFEKVVELAYRKHGYSVQRRGGAKPDGGIDLLIRKDGETKAVQCKHWQTLDVGLKDIREFLGALTHAKLAHGVFITLKGYTPDAKNLADGHGIQLLNAEGLAQLLQKTDSRFDPKLTELLIDRQKHCPKCESQMVLRIAKKVGYAGQKFWGCSKYPRCRFTLAA